MQELHLLQTKVAELLRRYQAVVEENERLSTRLAAQQAEMQQMRERLELIEEQQFAKRVSTLLLTQGDNESIKAQLDEVINVIDSILKTLHE